MILRKVVTNMAYGFNDDMSKSEIPEMEKLILTEEFAGGEDTIIETGHNYFLNIPIHRDGYKAIGIVGVRTGVKSGDVGNIGINWFTNTEMIATVELHNHGKAAVKLSKVYIRVLYIKAKK